MTRWKDERNQQARKRLERALPPVFPTAVLAHALSQPWTPPLPRLAMESYWRSHPLRADRLARRLAAFSGTPTGWAWETSSARESGRPFTFRSPPAPFREAAFQLGPGHCCICGQPVFRFGWHRDLWEDGKLNGRARWHACCVVAWKLWNAPGEHVTFLSRLQGRRCAVTQKRLLKAAEADHRVPLFSVWRHHRESAWPDLLRFWGFPNLQAVNQPAHRTKTASEALDRVSLRAAARHVRDLSQEQAVNPYPSASA